LRERLPGDLVEGRHCAPAIGGLAHLPQLRILIASFAVPKVECDRLRRLRLLHRESAPQGVNSLPVLRIVLREAVVDQSRRYYAQYAES
jgi:hypothetical protein